MYLRLKHQQLNLEEKNDFKSYQNTKINGNQLILYVIQLKLNHKNRQTET